MIFLWLIGVWLIPHPEWGFYGHRLINRLAVYTLPTEMIGWYKPNLDYITDHAVDPDKRRYATRHEAVRHYIDLDHWGSMPFDHMPRYWTEALAFNLHLFVVRDGDTLDLLLPVPYQAWSDTVPDLPERLKLVHRLYLSRYYEDPPAAGGDSVLLCFPALACRPTETVYFTDALTPHGILPYHLQAMQRRLTNAFSVGEPEHILRISAELGHYIADACVPLHTTENYNGQLTNQVGIHAFWESRIPELFAMDDFDFVVGSASYIENLPDYFWNLVLTSHQEVDKVLSLEKQVSQTFPTDKQFCFEDRMSQNIRTQCPEYALAYHLAMDKMVEDRLRLAIKALGDAWYTAWIDAGQPNPPRGLKVGKRSLEDEDLDKAVQGGKILGREHDP